jgi:FkbM family methyltransferase
MEKDSVMSGLLHMGLKGLNAVLGRTNLRLVRTSGLSLEQRIQRLAGALENVDLRLKSPACAEHVSWIEAWLVFVKRLSLSHGISFWNEDGDLYAKVEGITLHVTSDEELLMMCEVFHDGDYAYEQSGSVIALDVGMNVGIASLYLASLPCVRHVYGFEPFTPTYLAAQRNLALNPELAARITAHNWGLGPSEDSLTCRYSFSRKGNMGPCSKSAFLDACPDTVDQKIEVRRASDQVRRLKDRHPEEGLLLKLDVEGAEQGILSDLIAERSIDVVDALAMEWHYTDPRQITKALADCCFGVQVRGGAFPGAWMVYAVRRSPEAS